MDHVINRGFTMEEAGRRVQPNVNRSTVSSIGQTFRRENNNIVKVNARLFVHSIEPHNNFTLVAEQQYLTNSKNKKFATWS